MECISGLEAYVVVVVCSPSHRRTLCLLRERLRLLCSRGMVSKGPLAISACRYGLASPMFGEAIIMRVPSCKHDESQSRTSERRVGRSEMPGLNV